MGLIVSYGELLCLGMDLTLLLLFLYLLPLYNMYFSFDIWIFGITLVLMTTEFWGFHVCTFDFIELVKDSVLSFHVWITYHFTLLWISLSCQDKLTYNS